MSRFPIVLPFLLTLSLSACLSTGVRPPGLNETSLTLEPKRVAILPTGNLPLFAFSEDGTSFLAGNGSVALYRSSDFTLLEGYYAPIPNHKPPFAVPTGGVFAAGYIDANTWYFSEWINNSDETADSDDSIVNLHFRSIQPSHEIAKHSLINPPRNWPAITVNKDYFVFKGTVLDYEPKEPPKRNEKVRPYYFSPMINWRTGKQHRVKIHATPFGLDRYELTRSNRLLSLITKEYGYFELESLLDDPINNKTEFFEWDIILSPNERYLVDLSSGYCELKETGPEKEIGNVGKRPSLGRCSDYFPRKSTNKIEVVFAPDGQSFAISTEHSIGVYRITPFQLVMEAKAHAFACRIALSGDGSRLAVLDRYRVLRVWDTRRGKLSGQRVLPSYNGEQKDCYSRLAFQPGSNTLFLVTADQISVFEFQ